jgi:tryptophan 2,3-dioxygenase
MASDSPYDRLRTPSSAAARLQGALAAFDLRRYLETTRREGRLCQPAHTRATALGLYKELCDLQGRRLTVTPDLASAAELAHRTLRSDWRFSCDGKPRYSSYLNMPVLNWYLGTHERTCITQIWSRCSSAISVLLRDALQFETRSLAGREPLNQSSFDPGAVEVRIEHLATVLCAANAEETPSLPDSSFHAPERWDACVGPSNELALIHLTAFPLTQEHDEYFFIRTLQISECCFWAILTATLATTEALKHEQRRHAERYLDVALSFSALLPAMLHTLKTMTSPRFERFREQTGDASALQSRSYQLMQVALTGTSAKTLGTITSVAELRDLRYYDTPDYVPLASAYEAPKTVHKAQQGVVAVKIDELSRELRKWRKLHRGIVRTYLTARAPGTGGTDGTEYLKLTVDMDIAASLHQDDIGCGADCRGTPSHYGPRHLSWALTDAAGHARAVLSGTN